MLLSDKPPVVYICALQADGKRDALHRRELNICTLDTLSRAGELNEPVSFLSSCLSALNSAVPETFSLFWVGVEQPRCVWFVPQVHEFDIYNLAKRCAQIILQKRSHEIKHKIHHFGDTDVSNEYSALLSTGACFNKYLYICFNNITVLIHTWNRAAQLIKFLTRNYNYIIVQSSN